MNQPLSNAQLDTIAVLQQRRHKFILYGELEATANKDWLVRGLLGAGEQSAFYGRPGSGKSVLVGDLALHIAAGLDWHGHKVKQGAVLYIALERCKLVERRTIAWRRRHDIERLPFAIIGGVMDFREARTASDVIGIVREVEAETRSDVVLIIVDTISRALAGGDENSPKDMGALVRTVGVIQSQTHAHVLTVHHTPQEGSERLRGHGALLGAMDTTVNVEKLTGGHRTASVVKANDSEEGEAVSFNLESVVIGTDDEGQDTTAPVVVPAAESTASYDAVDDKLTPNQRTMFAMLHDAGPSGLTTDEWNALARDAGIGTKRRADLVDIRSKLKAKEMVNCHGDRWTVRH